MIVAPPQNRTIFFWAVKNTLTWLGPEYCTISSIVHQFWKFWSKKKYKRNPKNQEKIKDWTIERNGTVVFQRFIKIAVCKIRTTKTWAPQNIRNEHLSFGLSEWKHWCICNCIEACTYYYSDRFSRISTWLKPTRRVLAAIGELSDSREYRTRRTSIMKN